MSKYVKSVNYRFQGFIRIHSTNNYTKSTTVYWSDNLGFHKSKFSEGHSW